MGRFDADDAQTNPTQYLYDADGKRKRSVDSKTARYIHGLGGELLADASTSGITKEYAYRNGDLLVTTTTKAPADFRWLVKDHLGTPRIVADETGNLSAIKRHDYLPFGEEIGSTVGGRDPSQGYGSPQADGIRNQFTGYERDDESGLDFAEARMFGSSFGRFTSADPIFITSERLTDPQRFNLYSYVRNNPGKYTDVSGQDIKLDPKVKKVDADRIIKAASETYQREIGKRAIDRMEESKIPVIITVGKVDGAGQFGRTSIAVTGDPSKPETLKPVSITITIDLEAIDKSEGRVELQDVLNNEIYHGREAVNDPAKQYLIASGARGQEEIELEDAQSDNFENVKNLKTTMSETDAQNKVKNIFGAPTEPSQTTKPPVQGQQPPKPELKPTPKPFN